MQASIYTLRTRDLLTFCVLALLLLGVLMVQSAAANVTDNTGWYWTKTGVKHLYFVATGLVVFFLFSRLDYRRLVKGEGWRKPALWFLYLAAICCVLVLIPKIGIERNGARRWLPLGPLQLQPSEWGKWSIVLFLAWWLSARPVDLSRFLKGFVPTLVPVALICLLVVIQDFGTAALIGLCAILMCLVGNLRVTHLLVVMPPALGAAWWFVRHKEYRWKRMTAFLDPFANPQTEGYHMVQSLLSFATGGIFGKGLGNGIQKLGYLPEDTTDFIFAVICEELGVFGAMLTIALYLGIIYVAWNAIKSCRDPLGKLLAFGIGAMIGLQALINIAVATVSMPTKGLSLPLVSAGGSGMIITCAALGVLSNICRAEEAKSISQASCD